MRIYADTRLICNPDINHNFVENFKFPHPLLNTLKLKRAPDKVRIFISLKTISSPNPMIYHLLESSHRDDSNKWSNIGFGEEITKIESIEVHFTHLIWSSDPYRVLLVLIFSFNLLPHAAFRPSCWFFSKFRSTF